MKTYPILLAIIQPALPILARHISYRGRVLDKGEETRIGRLIFLAGVVRTSLLGGGTETGGAYFQ